MRFFEKCAIAISEDISTDPKMIRFSEEFDDLDTTLVRVVTRQESFPVGTSTINLGNITQGRYLAIKPKANIIAIINGQTISLRANKVFRAWADFTTLSITVTSAVADVSIVAAGI